MHKYTTIISVLQLFRKNSIITFANYLIPLPLLVLRWGNTKFLLEGTAEVTGVSHTDHVGDLGHVVLPFFDKAGSTG